MILLLLMIIITIMIIITFKGSATKGQFRKCGWTVSALQSMTPQKQGKGVQQGSGIPKNTIFKLALYHGPLTFPVGLPRRGRTPPASPSWAPVFSFYFQTSIFGFPVYLNPGFFIILVVLFVVCFKVMY